MAEKILGAVVVQLQADVQRLERDLKRANNRFKRGTNALEKSAKASARRISNAFAGAFAGLSVAAGFKGIINITDDLKRMEGRLKLVTNSQQEFEDAFKSIANIANDTRSDLGATADLYTRIAQSTEQLGLSQKEVAGITETVNKAFQISGASAQSAAGAAVQFGQGLASGALRGEELNSVLENTPRLARVIADGINVPIGALKDLASEGRLTTEVLTQAISSQSNKITDEFQKLPKTVGQSLTQLRNQFNLAFRDVDVSPVSNQIDDLTRKLSDPRIIAGINTIAAAVVNLVTNVATGIAKVGEFGKLIGETFARAVNGPVKDVENLTKALNKQQQLLANFKALPVPPQGLVQSVEKEISSLTAQIAALKSEYVEASEAAKNIEPPKIEAPSTVILPPAKKKGRTGKTDAQRRAEASADIIRGLQDELALSRAITEQERARVEAAIERRGLVGSDVQLGAQLQDQIRQAEARQKDLELQREQKELAKSVIEDLEKQVSGYNDLSESAQILVELETGRYKSLEAASKQRIEQLAKELAEQERIKKEAEDTAKRQKEEAEKLAKTAQEFGNTFSSAFEDAIVEGNKFSDVLKSLEKDIIRILARKLVTEPLQESLSGALGNLTKGGGGFGGFFGSLLGRAGGGPVPMGQPVLVGEMGPEIFVPSTRGNILSNAETKRASGGTNVVNININTPNADSFIQSSDQVAAKSAFIAQRAVGRNS